MKRNMYDADLVGKLCLASYELGIAAGKRQAAEEEIRCATREGRVSNQVAPTSQSGVGVVHAAQGVRGYETRTAMHSPSVPPTVILPTSHKSRTASATYAALIRRIRGIMWSH